MIEPDRGRFRRERPDNHLFGNHITRIMALRVPDTTSDEGGGLTTQIRYQRILFYYHPYSGKGQGEEVATRLKGDVCNVIGEPRRTGDICQTSISYNHAALVAQLKKYDLVVVASGDGSLIPFYPALAESRTPLYHAGAGNKSLLAEHHSMGADSPSFRRALLNTPIAQHYTDAELSIPRTGENPVPPKCFFAMLEIGPNSRTVQKVCAVRKTTVSDLDYVLQGAFALAKFRLPTLTIAVDGKDIVTNRQGTLVVANAPIYANNQRPVPNADPTSSTLHLTFLPQPNFLVGIQQELKKGWHMLRKTPALFSQLEPFSGNEVKITLTSAIPYPVQIDGDHWFELRQGESIVLRKSSSTFLVVPGG